MPEAILKFNLPEEQSEFDITSNAGKYYSVLWDLDQYLRNFIKYPSDREDPILTDTMDMVRKELHKLMASYHIDFDI
jgi:hypothetical protein